MARKDGAGQYPKRGASPTPRNVLAAATPYKPEEPGEPGLAGGYPGAGSDFKKIVSNGRNEKKDH